MPINEKLKRKNFPMPIRFGEEPKTQFVNNLLNIKVDLMQAPSLIELKEYCIPFANATWADFPKEIYSKLKGPDNSRFADLIMHHIFSRKILPTTLETIRVNFLISGISMQEVTHILRYRRAVFSAECSGDKWVSNKNMVVPTAVENSEEFYARYKNITKMCKELYCDMIDSKEINIHDARYILPRGIETFYFMSMSLSDAIQFVWDRIDKQIQPQSDNVLAYRMMIALVYKYPILIKTLSPNYLHQPANFYVKTARQFRSTNWYCPDKDSDVFEYNPNDFVYGLKKRDEFLGTNLIKTDVFKNILESIEFRLKSINDMVDKVYGKDFFLKDIPDFLLSEV